MFPELAKTMRRKAADRLASENPKRAKARAGLFSPPSQESIPSAALDSFRGLWNQ
jgi:hypothetical protein